MIDMNPKTIFSDIDGTLVHQVDFESINPQTSIALPDVVEKMNQSIYLELFRKCYYFL